MCSSKVTAIFRLYSAILLHQWACAKGYVHLAYAFDKLMGAWNVNNL